MQMNYTRTEMIYTSTEINESQDHEPLTNLFHVFMLKPKFPHTDKNL